MTIFCNCNMLWILLILTIPSTTNAAPVYLSHICPNTTIYTPNSTFKPNLNIVLSSLSSNSTKSKGFYSTTAGRNPPNIAYGLSLCRGDVTPDVCRDCVSTATREIGSRCPKEKVAIIWYDECMVRYSNRSFFYTVDDRPMLFMFNGENITQPTRFQKVLASTMNDLRTRASNDQIIKGFATNSRKFTNEMTLYGLAQCTPDLSGMDCDRCLGMAISSLSLPQFSIDKRRGGRVLVPSCTLRFELYPFYNNFSAPAHKTPPPPTPASSTKSKGKGVPVKVIAIVAPICVSLVIFIIGYCYLTRKSRRKDAASTDQIDDDEIIIPESLQFDLGKIQVATNNFSPDNKIGEGGFGEIFKGVLPDGNEIAVKRLSKSSGQGAQEFKNEVVLVAKIQHRNLVRLLGFCLQEEEKILIYDYIPNKSLDHILFDPERRRLLDWSKRYKIIGGIARGMVYLHEDSQLRIIHRDLKTSNILLDKDMNAKISDFGTARIFGVDQTHGNTSRIVGTFGYMSPEYAMHGQFSVKSDVFSFGVLVLEIISGKKNTSFYESDRAEDLLGHAWKLWKNNTPLELMDPTLTESYSSNEAIRCINIALLCVQEDVEARPSMASVLMMLTSNTVTVHMPPEPPPFYNQSITESTTPEGFKSDQSTSNSVPWSVDDASITGVYAR